MRLSLTTLILATLLGGCVHSRDSGENRPAPYYGETLPMAEVVKQINANNSKIPTLWADVEEMEVYFYNDKKKLQHEILGGTLNYRSPRDFALVGSKSPIGTVVQIGSNQDKYWFSLPAQGGPDTAWWGRYKYLGAECTQEIPIRPDLLLEVLGVFTINPDFNQLPVPVMRFNHAADAYMFIWNARSREADRWLAVKEVWYDRPTLQPRMVVVFDPNGRVVLEAHLSKPVPVKVAGLPQEHWPTIASEFQLYFPESKSKLRLTLSGPTLRHNGFPKDLTFRFDPTNAGVSKVTQLDEACGP